MFFIDEGIEMSLQPRTPRVFFERNALPILLSLLSYTLNKTQSSPSHHPTHIKLVVQPVVNRGVREDLFF